MSDKKYEEITLQIHSDAKMALEGWTHWRWSPEKTYPYELTTKVFVKLRNGDVHDKIALPVSHWHSDTTAMSSWFNTHSADDPNGDDIVAYRLEK